MKNPAGRPMVATEIDRIIANISESTARSGIVEFDFAESKALQEGAKAYVYLLKPPPIDESKGSDKECREGIESAKSSIKILHAKCAVLEARLTNAREQTARLPEPRQSLMGLSLSGIGLFSICFAPTVFSVFMSSIPDAPLAWLVSLLIGAAIGVFLMQLLLQPRATADTSRHSKLIGFGLGVGFGILRLSKAEGVEDVLIALGLTILECVAVAGLDRFAEKHRQAVSTFLATQAQSTALEQAIAELKNQIQGERAHYDSLRAELKQRETEAFDTESVSECVAWAAEAAYRGAVKANQRLLEGGSGFATPQAW